MTLSPALSHSLRHSQASIKGSSPCLDVYSYLSIVSHEEILAVVNQIVLSSFPCLLWPTKAIVGDRNGYLERVKGVNTETFEYQPEGIGYEVSLGVDDILDLITAKRALASSGG